MVYSKERYEKNKAIILAANKRYYERHREVLVAKQQIYDRAHLEQRRIAARKRTRLAKEAKEIDIENNE